MARRPVQRFRKGNLVYEAYCLRRSETVPTIIGPVPARQGDIVYRQIGKRVKAVCAEDHFFKLFKPEN